MQNRKNRDAAAAYVSEMFSGAAVAVVCGLYVLARYALYAGADGRVIFATSLVAIAIGAFAALSSVAAAALAALAYRAARRAGEPRTPWRVWIRQ
jgi:hypothetical protein